MADEPDKLVLQLLREVRAGLGEVSARLGGVERKLDGIEGEVKGLRTMAQMALGTASGADFVAERAQKLAEDTNKRLDGLIAALKRREIDVDA